MNKAEAFNEVTTRQKLRRDNGLPPLDVRTEYEHLLAVARMQEYTAFCLTQSDLRARLRESILDEKKRETGRDYDLSAGGRFYIDEETQNAFEFEIARRFGKQRPPTPSRHKVSYGDRRDVDT